LFCALDCLCCCSGIAFKLGELGRLLYDLANGTELCHISSKPRHSVEIEERSFQEMFS
jgi:hypothetical protein